MVETSVVNIAKNYADIVREHFQVSRVILFGSYARGTQRKDSDIDIAVILKEIPSDLLQAETELFILRRNVDIRIEPVIINDDSHLSGFYEDICKYGTVVYSEGDVNKSAE
jgi:uncharacterized protein